MLIRSNIAELFDLSSFQGPELSCLPGEGSGRLRNATNQEGAFSWELDTKAHKGRKLCDYMWVFFFSYPLISALQIRLPSHMVPHAPHSKDVWTMKWPNCTKFILFTTLVFYLVSQGLIQGIGQA